MSMESIYAQIPDASDFVMRLLEEAGSNKIKKRGNEIHSTCPNPAHNDKNPSFSVNVGQSHCPMNCLACGFTGNLLTLVQTVRGLESKDAIREICKEFSIEDDLPYKSNSPLNKKVLKTLNKTISDDYHRLLKTPSGSDIFTKLISEWKIGPDVIDDYQLGYSEKYNRLTFPIFDRSGRLRNIRMYSFDPEIREEHGKCISYAPGTGENRLWPIQALDQDEIWFCEGEKDAIIGISRGLNCITMTAGASSWNPEFAKDFMGKKVNIIFDQDNAGTDGKVKILKDLEKVCKAKDIILPLEEDCKDLADYLIKMSGNVPALESIRNETDDYSSSNSQNLEFDDDEFEDVELAHAVNAEMYRKPIRWKARVIGKSSSPFAVPREVVVRAHPSGTNRKPVSVNGGGSSQRIIFERSNSNVLECYGNSKEFWRKWVLNQCTFSTTQCRKDVEFISEQNVVEVYLAPEIDRARAEDHAEFSSVERVGYFMGNDIDVRTNCAYSMEGFTIPSPKNGMAIHVILELKGGHDDLEGFELSGEQKKDLQVFATSDSEDDVAELNAKLEDIYDDFAINVTRIFGRPDLHMAFDLAYHSALHVEIAKEKTRGWIDALVMGDTRTGKNYVFKALARHFRAGESISGENSTYAGLVGGMKKNDYSGGYTLQWGKMPQCDGGLLVIDEASGLEHEVIAGLKEPRSEGISKIDKVGTNQNTLSRVRLIMVSNPKDGSNLHDMNYPILAVRSLVGNEADVARFDYVCMVSNIDVPQKVIEDMKDREREHIYTEERCSTLVKWAWSRHLKNIIITTDATKLLSKLSSQMVTRYDESIQLIQGSNFSLKLGRVATAIAIRTFSTEDGVNVIVRQKHIVAACNFINRLYSSKACQYHEFSKQERHNKHIRNEDKLWDFINVLKKSKLLNGFVMEIRSKDNMDYTQEQFGSLIGEGEPFRSTPKKIIGYLTNMCNCFKLTSGSKYRRTEAFIRWLSINIHLDDDFDASSFMDADNAAQETTKALAKATESSTEQEAQSA